jgi:hypothetical protein
LAPILIGLSAFVGSAIIGLVSGIRQPTVHDEFSYLLAADTFAHGRLTNSTHPMWVHFESFHVIHRPTYMSKFPPGPGAMLALGQWLSGYPIVGVWITMGMMCGAICWMLQLWISPRWGVIGGLLSVLHPYLGIDSYWAQSYWGGALAATGGALVLGGVRSLVKEPTIPRAFLTGTGLAILSNSRPYEGFLVGVCAAFALSLGLIRQPSIDTKVLLRKAIWPLLLMCTAAAVWIGYYNLRLTGNMLRLPYRVHEAAYSVVPLFVWQDFAPSPEYRHPRIKEFHTSYLPSVHAKKDSWIESFITQLNEWLLYLYVAGNILLIPLIVNGRALARWIFRNWWARLAFANYSVVMFGLLIATYSELHYSAPIIALNYYLVVQGLRVWCKRDRRLKPFIVPITLFLVVMLLVITGKQRLEGESNPLALQTQRQSVLTHLRTEAGKHVVLVKYGPEHPFDYEWVYNEAEIDQAKIVWAHDMGKSKNCELVQYFKNHLIWSLTVERDDTPVKLEPFPKHSCIS